MSVPFELSWILAHHAPRDPRNELTPLLDAAILKAYEKAGLGPVSIEPRPWVQLAMNTSPYSIHEKIREEVQAAARLAYPPVQVLKCWPQYASAIAPDRRAVTGSVCAKQTEQ